MPEAIHAIADATCTACGCLCDDIVLTVRNDQILAAEHACPIGAAWFLADHGPGDRPMAMVEGEPATADDARNRAVEILTKARSPLILGLTRTSLESQAKAVAIADRIGAVIDPGNSADSLPGWQAIQRVGIVSATLGEVKNRADVIVFWGVDPVTTHPRHLERYSVGPRGRFVPEGRAGRTVVVVDHAPTATSAVADRFVRVVPDEQGEVLATLRALVNGVTIPEADDPLQELAETLKTARYGAFFFGPSLGRSRGGAATVEEALKLVRDLNRSTRFVALTLGSAGNATGAEAVLSWQAGSPRAVDFSAGFPQFSPDTATAEAMLSHGMADAALIIADDPAEWLSETAQAHLGRIPTVVIDPGATSRNATVALNSATTGIHAGGTVMRCDGATLPLRPALTTTFPTDLEWLSDLERRLKAISP